MKDSLSDAVQIGTASTLNVGAAAWTYWEWIQNGFVFTTLLLNLLIAAVTAAMAFAKFSDFFKKRSETTAPGED